MSLAQIAEQLAQLTETLKQTNALISRLSTLNFQPGSEPLDSENTVRVELAQDIHDSLKQLEEDVGLLKEEAEDVTSTSTSHRRRDSERDREKTRLSAQVARIAEDIKHSRSRFRKAQLTAKKASETAKQRERELVFASLRTVPEENTNGDVEGRQTPDLFAGRGRRQQHKFLSKDEQEVNASSDVTAALRRTHNLLSTEVSRSRFAQETFDESTAALAQLGEDYANLDTILTNSRNLLGTLLRSQKSDTWYLETAFYILIATLCWLFFRRILYGPFIKLPLFLWNVGIVLLRWIVLKPIWLFLTTTGVITTTTVSASGRGSTRLTTTPSRPPLIVQPSASGGIPRFEMADREAINRGGGVPAGGGGSGAKVGKDGERVSDQIGEMHDQSQQESEGNVQRRGDGTILQERGDIPKNPKKKAFEADVEDAKQRRKRDEL